jgi:hypothetical protein
MPRRIGRPVSAFAHESRIDERPQIALQRALSPPPESVHPRRCQMSPLERSRASSAA